MPTITHAELAIQLLRDAAGFFRNVGDQNPEMSNQMYDNAAVYEEVADLLDLDPFATIELDEDDE